MPWLDFDEVVLSSPGDRDLVTDLRESPADFFTEDLDQAVRSGEIDCAIHSAKDVPDPVPEGLDWFWLPWRADARDAIVLARGKTMADLPPHPVTGISSERRQDYCAGRFPGARFKPIRGNIGERLAQLDAGEFDVVIMAAAALVRLGMEDRVTEWIPLDELPTPDGQGTLALTFKAGNAMFLRLRSLAVRAVTFAGGGAGRGSGTLATLEALGRCDVCLHDTLLDHSLLDAVPPNAKVINVGKRCGKHSVAQAETTESIATWARRGARVVRLKGGDPGVFGRLAEEVDALDALQLPYRVLPGVSSLNSATTGTGMLLTRRGLSRGFCVMTPREQGGAVASVRAEERADLPVVFFMAVGAAGDVAEQLLADGRPATTPAAAVFNAGFEDEHVLRGTLGDIRRKIEAFKEQEQGHAPCPFSKSPAPAAQGGRGRGHDDNCCVGTAGYPGLLIVGDVASHGYRREWGALGGCRVLLTCSEALQARAAALVADFGGVPLQRPLIRLALTDAAVDHAKRIDVFDWVVLTSPSAVRCFLELLKRAQVDIRRVPKLLVCGGGTARALEAAQLHADAQPAADFSGAGTVAAARSVMGEGDRVLRLRSVKAGPDLAEALRELGATVEDCVLYRNESVDYDRRAPFDAVFFASASAVEVFAATWGRELLEGRVVVAIGKPTLAALRKIGADADVVPAEATVEAGMEALAARMVSAGAAGCSFQGDTSS